MQEEEVGINSFTRNVNSSRPGHTDMPTITGLVSVQQDLKIIVKHCGDMITFFLAVWKRDLIFGLCFSKEARDCRRTAVDKE